MFYFHFYYILKTFLQVLYQKKTRELKIADTAGHMAVFGQISSKLCLAVMNDLPSFVFTVVYNTT